MKQKDLTLIAVIVIVSSIFSIVISNYLFASPANRSQSVETVGTINSTFNAPKQNSQYFNPNSINPAQTIQTGPTNNQVPFGTPPPTN